MRNIINLALVIAMTSCVVSCGPPAPRGDDALWKEKLNRGMDAIRQNKWEEAQSFLDQSLVEAEKFGKSDKRVAGSLVNLASCYANAKEFDKAIEVSRRALAIDEKEFGPGYEVAFDLNQLGTYLAVSGQHEEAVKELTRAVGMRAKLEGSKGRLQLGTSLSNLGESYLELGSLEKAEKVLKEALTIFREE
ncbi:MAG: tetratricopeptide repeat protein, partial [Cyanobacteria bacterium HKST-UBA01]|nr:tetratricopeptide repeat protein [Cyanobacteria bacterium HKST-UBA01]